MGVGRATASWVGSKVIDGSELRVAAAGDIGQPQTNCKNKIKNKYPMILENCTVPNRADVLYLTRTNAIIILQ